MTESAEKIKKVLEEHHHGDIKFLDENTQEFIKSVNQSVEKIIEEKYNDSYRLLELEMSAAIEEQKNRAKNYAYDSLCLRYRDARFKQARLEMEMDYSCGIKEKDRKHYEDRAIRDCMRFYQILDDVIGGHN